MKYFLAFLLLIFLNIFLYSGSFEDYLKQEQEDFNQYKTALDEEWKNFSSFTKKSPYKIKKPTKLPKAKEVKIKKKLLEKDKKVKISKIEEPIKKKISKFKPIVGNYISLSFLNQRVKIPYDKKITKNIGHLSNKSISTYYNNLTSYKYQKTISFIKKYKNNRGLNDWATLLLVKDFANKIHRNKNEQIVFTWFLLIKLNYDVKIAISNQSNKKAVLLANVSHSLYSTPYFKISNKKYYDILKTKAKNINTYKGNIGSFNAFNFTRDNQINSIDDYKIKKLSFKFNNKRYNLKTFYSPTISKLYQNMPQSDYKIYFDSKIDNKIQWKLLNELSKIIKNKSEIEAINILLRFTQKAFKYKTDEDNFGYEKVLFPEETIFYSYSDCEDRSLIFSYLIKKLLKKDIVLIKYSDHLATAIKMPKTFKGDSIKYKGYNYYIADPTYINANLAMAMPQYKNAKIDIIE